MPVVIVSRYGSAISPYSGLGTPSQLTTVLAIRSGMEPLIRAVLSKLIGAEGAAQIDIIANGVKVENDGTWEIQFRHPER